MIADIKENCKRIFTKKPKNLKRRKALINDRDYYIINSNYQKSRTGFPAVKGAFYHGKSQNYSCEAEKPGEGLSTGSDFAV